MNIKELFKIINEKYSGLCITYHNVDVSDNGETFKVNLSIDDMDPTDILMDLFGIEPQLKIIENHVVIEQSGDKTIENIVNKDLPHKVSLSSDKIISDESRKYERVALLKKLDGMSIKEYKMPPISIQLKRIFNDTEFRAINYIMISLIDNSVFPLSYIYKMEHTNPSRFYWSHKIETCIFFLKNNVVSLNVGSDVLSWVNSTVVKLENVIKELEKNKI